MLVCCYLGAHSYLRCCLAAKKEEAEEPHKTLTLQLIFLLWPKDIVATSVLCSEAETLWKRWFAHVQMILHPQRRPHHIIMIVHAQLTNNISSRKKGKWSSRLYFGVRTTVHAKHVFNLTIITYNPFSLLFFSIPSSLGYCLLVIFPANCIKHAFLRNRICGIFACHTTFKTII